MSNIRSNPSRRTWNSVEITNVVLTVISLLVAVWALKISYTAFKVPLEESQSVIKREQPSKLTLYLPDEQNTCDMNKYPQYRMSSTDSWDICISNNSDTPLYDIYASVTAMKFTTSPYETLRGGGKIAQINPSANHNFPSSIEGTDDYIQYRTPMNQDIKIDSIRFAFTFKDSAGVQWYRAYELSHLEVPYIDTKANEVQYAEYKNLVDLTDKKPDNWSQIAYPSKENYYFHPQLLELSGGKIHETSLNYIWSHVLPNSRL